MTPTPLTRAAAQTIELESVHATDPGRVDALDNTGFEIGWDHAHHGLVPPAELLLEGTPLGQGWRAGRRVYAGRTLAATRATRQWLALRLQAWLEGIPFETQQCTPNYLAQIEVERCPVLRTPLGGAAGQADAAVVVRLNVQAGYAAGNLATLSLRAAQARAGVDVREALRRAHHSAVLGAPVEGFEAAAWLRLTALGSFTTPLPFHAAARMPLAVLPPNRVRLLNPVQCLQALLTLQFAHPGWSARARTVAQWLPEHTLRHDYHLFIGALVPRVLEAASQGAALRPALEDAWLQERLQRRWQHFVLSLGEAGTESLLDRVAAQGLAGVRLLEHEPAQAVEGWALSEGPQPPRVGTLSTPVRRAPRRAAARVPARLGLGASQNPSAGAFRG